MHMLQLLLGLAAYLLLARFSVRRLGGRARDAVFALVNLAGCYFLVLHQTYSPLGLAFLLYLAVVLLLYLLMRACARAPGAWPWLAFFAPLFFLVLLRYTPASLLQPLRDLLVFQPDVSLAAALVGFSYLAFRAGSLVLEVRNGVVPPPGLGQYLGFCFFLPTMLVGPINPYSNHRRGFDPDPPPFLLGRCALRILIGLVKFLFLGNFFNQLTYAGLLLDGHYHPWTDLPVAAVCYYLYLYCNFSGFCDIAIGAAGLIGIPVAENFRDPFYARNMREFWNRWHITLSQYMRDVCFAPFSKFFARLLGPARVDHAVALTVLVVFLLIGIWHGVGWNYAVFGLLQGLGVIVTHYYTLALKKHLGRDRFAAYNANPRIRAVAVAFTFTYFSATLFFFANSPAEIRQILSLLR